MPAEGRQQPKGPPHGAPAKPGYPYRVLSGIVSPRYSFLRYLADL